jgi:hypothetical protein
MRTRLHAASIGIAALAAALSVLPAMAQRPAVQQHAFVTVVDGQGNPVRDLGAGDFVVREDGVAREVLAVGPAALPSPISILVDTSQAAEPLLIDLRRSLTAFVERLSAADPTPQVALWTFGERPIKVADFTNPMLLELGIERVFHRSGSGAYFLEAVVEAAKEIDQADAARSAIVAVVIEDGPEFSGSSRTQVAEAVQRAGSSLWTIVLQARESSLTSPEARERSQVLADVTKQSGGLNRPILTRTALASAFEGVAALLGAQQRITYGRPDTLIPPKTLEITTRRDGLRVLAPTWAAQ